MATAVVHSYKANKLRRRAEATNGERDIPSTAASLLCADYYETTSAFR